MAAVTLTSDLEPKEINYLTASIVTQSIWHKMMGPDAMILVFLTVEC